MNTFRSNNNKTIENNADKHTYAKLLQQFPKIKFSYEIVKRNMRTVIVYFS
jgi:hypothetical protein